MSEGRTAAGAAHRVGTGTTRLVRAWRALPHESRLAAFASLALFLTLFLPWYQLTLIARAKTANLTSASATITGWGAFSFVEAAVLLVAAGVITLLFQRAEGRAFHLPGGDGGVITAAGAWTCVLIVWRIFDKQGATTNGPSASTSGVEWGIFIALAAGAFLAYSGSRIRAAHRPEPPLPGEDRPPAGSSAAATSAAGSSADGSSAARSGAYATAALSPRRGSTRSAPERPRRRARPPISDAPPWAGRTPNQAADHEPAAEPPRDRPRRRPSAAELFERVIPDDPPAMPFGRAKRSDVEFDRLAAPPSASASDEQLTIPFADRDDDTLPLAADHRRRDSDDATLAMGEDATVPLGKDETLPLGEDDTLPLDR
jgi:hypothetical protein